MNLCSIRVTRLFRDAPPGCLYTTATEKVMPYLKELVDDVC